ncbi:hypothetical protein GUITHDRAFT_43080, partial [Guillardia theta CCMP2712]
CDKGYFGYSYDQCFECPTGTYKDVIGFNDTCQDCPGYSTTEFTASTDFSLCKCGPGYTGADGSDCTACNSGYFKKLYGNYPCIQCLDTYVTVNDAQGNQACFCNYGYYQNDAGTCSACAVNTFKDTISNDNTCKICTNYSVTLQTGSTSINDCLCEPRYGLNNDGLCVPCDGNTYQDTFSRSTCVGCPLYSTSNGFSIKSDCHCIAGYTGPNGGPCYPCPANTYKTNVGNTSCTDCPLHTNSSLASIALASCQCGVGFQGAAGGLCQACDPNAYKGVIGDFPCKCKPGY